MKFQAVKGTRDFYPEEMRVRNWIIDTWRKVSLRNGFEEYDAPIFEYLDLFTAKSGDEIAEQLFRLTDRGGRDLAIRPEITPSLARMVNARINSLPRPIKWFSVPRLCRAENPQRGRLREFFQWNIDVIGEPSPLADAECAFVAVDALRELGLTSADVTVRYSSRPLTVAVLRHFGAGDEAMPKALATIDKRPKVPPETFEKMLAEVVGSEAAVKGVQGFLAAASDDGGGPEEAAGRLEGLAAVPEAAAALAALREYREHVRRLGIAAWCRWDPEIVRGLAYYTGIVYEVTATGERAVAGGGRYDNLLEVLGGPQVGGTGFGMGDVVLGLILQEKGKVPSFAGQIEYFVIDAEEGALDETLRIVGELRRRGAAATFSYKRGLVGKQLKDANRVQARKAVFVRTAGVTVKDLATGEQAERTAAEFLSGVGAM
jgi:histidyl-tRNA synthetase